MFDFGNHLKQLRISRGLTQKQVAIGANLTERGVQNYELNARKPSYDGLTALADFFDVSIDYLVGRTDNPNINK